MKIRWTAVLISLLLFGCAIQESTYVEGLGSSEWRTWPIEKIVDRYGYNTDGQIIFYIYRQPPKEIADMYERTLGAGERNDIIQ